MQKVAPCSSNIRWAWPKKVQQHALYCLISHHVIQSESDPSILKVGQTRITQTKYDPGDPPSCNAVNE